MLVPGGEPVPEGRTPRVAGVRGSRWAGHVGAVLLVLGGGAVPPGPRQPVDWSTGQVVVTLVAAVLVLPRHRWPRSVLAATVGLLVVAGVLDLFSLGPASAVGVATYATVLGLSRRAGWLTTAAVTVVVATAGVLAGMVGPQYALVVMLGGAVGEAIRSQRAVVAAVTERAERAERTREALARQRVAEDRLGIARDLHDVVAHQIAVINLHAGAATTALRSRPDAAQESLATIRQASREVLAEIGDLMATLRDPDQVDTGPLGLAQLDEVVRGFAVHGLDVRVRVDGDPVDLPGRVDVVALRVVQEALTNAHKHGTQGRAHVRLEYRPRSLGITVANPVDPAADAAQGVGTRQGLVGMSERVESVRGTLASGRDGAGTWVVAVDLPYGPQHPSGGEGAPA